MNKKPSAASSAARAKAKILVISRVIGNVNVSTVWSRRRDQLHTAVKILEKEKK